jgi:hypothetical protein
MTVQDWTAIISATANMLLVGGLWIAYYQIRADRRRGRIEATLEAQRLLVSGEIGLARRRLGDYSYRLAIHNATGPRMVRPTWEDLETGSDEIARSASDRQLGDDLLSDLFLFSRAFRRISIQIDYGLLDPKLAFDLFAWEAVYWHTFFSRVDSAKVEPLVALEQLAQWGWAIACQRGLASGTLAETIAHLDHGEVPDPSWRWLRDLGTDFAPQAVTVGSRRDNNRRAKQSRRKPVMPASTAGIRLHVPTPGVTGKGRRRSPRP